MNFYGYKRPDGRVGVRNKVLILPASVCASDTTRIISQQVVGSVTFNNQLGCSQVAPDQQFTTSPWFSPTSPPASVLRTVAFSRRSSSGVMVPELGA